jgi:glycolate dehydrogenase FAD-binding subunit
MRWRARMTTTLRPQDDTEVAAAIEWGIAGAKTFEIVGQGSKRGLGRAAQWDFTLDLSGLSGVTLYEPEELVLSARAGTPMAEIEALVASKNQELAFEPMDYGPILGKPSGQGTLGGVLAANLSGPRRIKAGAARDHFLGVAAVSGRGERFKSGGRVVKNVTGYDLCKVLAGSWGTLAAMTAVTVKVLPRAETEETLLVLGLADRAALSAMTAALGSADDVSGAAHLPAPAAQRLMRSAAGGGAVTALRLEGVAVSIAQRRRMLEALLKPFGPLLVIGAAASRALWQAIRDVMPFAADGEAVARPLWRISTAPTRGPDVVAQIAARLDIEAVYDWGGGLVWLALPAGDDVGAKLVRRAVATHGGHAMLVRAPQAVRATADVFTPQEAALAALTRRVKGSFDPKGVLGPGRMWAGV